MKSRVGQGTEASKRSLSSGVEANPVARLLLPNRHALTIPSDHVGSLPSSSSLLQVAKANAQDNFHSVPMVL